MNKKMVISCEHAGNEVPDLYRHLFEHNPSVLDTHRGYDIGALELTRTISDQLQVTPYIHPVSRLLIDLNRSLHNPSAFSEFVGSLDNEERQSLVRHYYEPHRKKVESLIADLITTGNYVLHLSVHTFTPELNGRIRNADVGLLYDPSRPYEENFCIVWKSLLEDRSDLNVRFNYPYEGVMDGFSTYLRKQFTSGHYAGIEIEVNQKFPQKEDQLEWKQVQKLVGQTLGEAYENWPDKESER